VILQVKCQACEETLSLMRAHSGVGDEWGRVLLCREELESLRMDLKRHTRDTCRHYKRQSDEYKLRMLDRP
jgi:hypothetical protein